MAANGNPTPIDKSQHAALDQVLRATHRNLRSTLAALPVDAQTASGLARVLSVERTTCQRAVFAVNQPFPGTALVGQLPGVEGLRGLARAIEQHWPANAEVQESIRLLRASVDEYAQIIRRVAGSRARLLARLEAAQPSEAPPPLDLNDCAVQLFEAAASLTGRRSQTWLSAHIYEPTTRPDRLLQTHAYGLIHHVAREDAVPLTFHVFGSPADTKPADDAAELNRFHALKPANGPEEFPAGLLQSFSSQPPPVVRSRQPNECLVQTVDPATGSSPACDIVFGLYARMAHPRTVSPYLEEIWAMINFPTRWLLLDVFLHRDVARSCIPGLDLHLWRPDFAATIGERWQTRFAQGPRLEVLGAGLDHVFTPAYDRQPELLRHLFAARGLDPAHYVGYRCQAEYPLWRTGYRMTLDFGDPE